METRSDKLGPACMPGLRNPPAFSGGETLNIGQMTVAVKSVGDSGKPLVVQFTIENGLAAPQHHWMSWKDGKLRSWDLPQIGETKRLPGVLPF